MDLNRNTQLQSQGIVRAQIPRPPVIPETRVKHKKDNKWLKLSQVVLLFSGTILVVALLFWIHLGNTIESQYVNMSKFQAVFISGGATNNQPVYSTYFGHITSINSQFLVLQDVYFVASNATNASAGSSNNLQLTELPCQVDAPYDQMIINRSQVSFWENLQNSGKIAQAINSYQTANPNGPNCSQP